MSEEENNVEENEDIKTWTLTVVKTISDNVEHNLNLMSNRIEVIEQQAALLTQAYAEMAVLIQTIMTTQLADINQEKFNQTFQDGIKDMFTVMSNGISQAESENERFYPRSDTPTPDSAS